ncbi:MAG: hypothetical protein J6A88_10725 [Oscillospiraceae bacterium]|nr:hypothetical protein [Oscillospiraceae bacterium]
MKKLSVLLILPLLLVLFSGCQASDPVAPPDPPPEGHEWVYCLTGRSSVNGYSFNFVYDEYGNLLEYIKTSDKGYVTKKVYDAQRNLLQDETIDGPVTYTYNENGDILSMKSHYNYLTYTYDEQGKVINRCYWNTDGTPRETYKYTYDENGTLISVRVYSGDETIPGHATEWDYDEQGNLLEEREYLDGEIYILDRYTYDDAGRILTEDTEVYGKPQSGSTHTYNAAGNEILMTMYLYEDGKYLEASSEWTYDKNENLLERKDIDWQGNVNLWVATYDKHGNQLTQNYTTSYGTQPHTTYIEWTYDSDGNMLSELRNLYGTTTYTTFVYDSAGRMIKKSVSYGKDSTQQAIYEWEYDYAGNLLTYTYSYDSTQQTTSYTYTRIAVPVEMVEKVRSEQAEILTSMDINDIWN